MLIVILPLTWFILINKVVYHHLVSKYLLNICSEVCTILLFWDIFTITLFSLIGNKWESFIKINIGSFEFGSILIGVSDNISGSCIKYLLNKYLGLKCNSAYRNIYGVKEIDCH